MAKEMATQQTKTIRYENIKNYIIIYVFHIM